MNTLQNLRSLVPPQSEATTTGNVLAVLESGAVSVLAGAKVITCFSSIPLQVRDRVRVQGRVVLSIIAPSPNEPSVYRV